MNCGNCKSQHEKATEVKACYGASGRFNTSVDLPEASCPVHPAYPVGHGRCGGSNLQEPMPRTAAVTSPSSRWQRAAGAPTQARSAAVSPRWRSPSEQGQP